MGFVIGIALDEGASSFMGSGSQWNLSNENKNNYQQVLWQCQPQWLGGGSLASSWCAYSIARQAFCPSAAILLGLFLIQLAGGVLWLLEGIVLPRCWLLQQAY
jgi:hypothetical protein